MWERVGLTGEMLGSGGCVRLLGRFGTSALRLQPTQRQLPLIAAALHLETPSNATGVTGGGSKDSQTSGTIHDHTASY